MARAPADVGALALGALASGHPLAASVLQAARGGRSPRAVLQLPAAATREEAKVAFKRLRISLHPDRVREQALERLAAEAFQAVGRAYEQLQQAWERRGSESQPSQPELQAPGGGGVNRWSAFTAGHAPARQQAPQQAAQQPERPAPSPAKATRWSKQPTVQLLKTQAAAAAQGARQRGRPSAAADASGSSDSEWDSESEAGSEPRRRSAPTLYGTFTAQPSQQQQQPRRASEQLPAKLTLAPREGAGGGGPAAPGEGRQDRRPGSGGGGGGKWAAQRHGLADLLRQPLKPLSQAEPTPPSPPAAAAGGRDLGGGSSGGSISSEDDARPRAESREREQGALGSQKKMAASEGSLVEV